MRGTILLGIVFGLLVAGVYTLCVMEQRNVFGELAWGVAATFKPGPGFRSPWLFWGVTAAIPALCGGLLGDCEWLRRSVLLTAAGAVLLAVFAGWFFADLPLKHGRAGANTRGCLVLDAIFLGALAGAKLAEKLFDRAQADWRSDG